MVFWLVVMIVFVLLVIFSMQVHTFFLHESSTRKIIRQLTSRSESHNVQEIVSGPVKDFLAKIQKEYGCPPGIRVYYFDGYVLLVTAFGVEPTVSNLPIFSVTTIFNRSKSCIFISPRLFFEKLSPTEDEVKWEICHEVDHIISDRWFRILKILCLHHINPLFKHLRDRIYLKKEKHADSFAAKVIGKETGVRLLEKLLEQEEYDHNLIKQRISALKALP